MKIADMSPEDCAKIIATYLHNVEPKIRKRFLKAIQFVIDEYDDSFVLPNEVKINDTTLQIDEINSGFDGETTAIYKSIMSRPSEFSITFNNKENFLQMLKQAGGSIS